MYLNSDNFQAIVLAFLADSLHCHLPALYIHALCIHVHDSRCVGHVYTTLAAPLPRLLLASRARRFFTGGSGWGEVDTPSNYSQHSTRKRRNAGGTNQISEAE